MLVPLMPRTNVRETVRFSAHTRRGEQANMGMALFHSEELNLPAGRQGIPACEGGVLQQPMSNLAIR